MFDEGTVEWENRILDEQAEYDRAMENQQKAVMRDYEAERDINRLNGLLNEANERIEALEKLIKETKEVAFTSPELNMCNYNHDDVGKLNTAMCEVFSMLDSGV
ncbi:MULTISPECIES: hypothetical protein [unclassified Endozoicomonas]|uniref:hypothetical protein n=1 Tax=unclassified Endozoicomonas TaxID=2644528 RepID=UPI003BB6AF49